MIKITLLDHNGRGIGKCNNKIVFVKNALPFEIVEITITNEKAKYIEANVSNFINKSENRINSTCPYFNECGGCDLLHMSYKNQLQFKQEKISNIVNKYLEKKIKINYIVKSDNPFNYRNKVTFQVKENIGFYKEKTYDLIKIDKCLLIDNKINNIIPKLNKLELKNINKIICKVGYKQLMIIIETACYNINIDCIKDDTTSIYIKNNNTYKLIYGEKNIYQNINNYKFIVSPDSFFQINNNVCEKIYNKIKSYIKDDKNIIDLYCGTGTIGIYISNSLTNITGIELNKYAIENANENKKINNIENIKFVCTNSNSYKIPLNVDTLIVDPPRNGLDKTTMKNILNSKPKKIVYTSCDPMTLVRDLKLLTPQYNIIELTPFDMFPNTKHVECVCILNHS